MRDGHPVSVTGYGRAHERIECNLPAKVRLDRYEVNCRIVNLSRSGAGIVLGSMLQLPLGSKAVLCSQEVGELFATVRWGIGARYGIEFSPSGHLSTDFFRTLASGRL